MAVNFSLTLVLLLSTCLNAAQTYILSYRAQVKNAVVISESYQFSQSMTPIKATKGKQLTIFSPHETNLNYIMQTNKDEILEFLMKYGTHTRSHEKVSDLKSSSLIEITVPPTYISIDFKDNYAIITRLIQE